MIPDKASAIVKGAALKSTDKVRAEETEKGLWKLTARGIGGHASLPEGTENAIGVLARYILENKIGDENDEKFLRLIMLLHKKYDGSALGVCRR